MSASNEGLGWLPIDAREQLEEEQDKASAEQAEALLALDPRARVLALMERAACRNREDQPCPLLRPADLKRVLDSFPGVVPADAEALAASFPAMVDPAA